MVNNLEITAVEVEELEKNLKKEAYRASKNAAIIETLSKFIFCEDLSSRINAFLNDEEIRSVAIYGLGYVGKALFGVLSKTSIEIKYVLDKNNISTIGKTPIVQLDEMSEAERVDAIIVTPTYCFEKISNTLSKRTSSKIISVDDILDACCERRINCDRNWFGIK